jgi:hypothetical protein
VWEEGSSRYLLSQPSRSPEVAIPSQVVGISKLGLPHRHIASHIKDHNHDVQTATVTKAEQPPTLNPNHSVLIPSTPATSIKQWRARCGRTAEVRGMITTAPAVLFRPISPLHTIVVGGAEEET